MWRTAARVVALALLVFTGGAGVYNGANERSDIGTALQAVVTGGVLAYGAFGLAAVAALARGWPSASWLVSAWGLSVTMVATLAPIAYGGPDASVAGALSGGVATALLAVAVWWATIRWSAGLGAGSRLSTANQRRELP